MRSNNLEKRQNWQNWKISTKIARKLRKIKTIISLGLEGKQWLACLLICLMLLPIFSLPVSASVRYADNNSTEFAPVNESLPIWTQIWRNLNAKIETWTTPYRAENASFSNEGNEEDKKKKKVKKDKSEKKDTKTTDEKTSDNEKSLADKTAAKTIEKTSKNAEVSKVKNKTNSKTKAQTTTAPTTYFFNQLPDDERDSVYAPENNLGAPPGQTEMDSSNQAAALRIRHRVGIANFNFGIPLAGLSGRGIDAGVGMTYNSRTWNKSCIQDYINGCTQDHFIYDVEQSWIAPGFSSGLGYLETSAEIRNVLNDPPNNDWHTEITPRGLADADGTRHQLGCISTTTIYGQTRCLVYGTVDGTVTKFQAKYWIDNPNNSSTPYTANYAQTQFSTTYPNGTKIWYSGGFGTGTTRKHYPIVIQDRNGNRLRVTYKADQSGKIDYITDTLNRQIKFYYENDSNGNPDKLVAVTIPGMGTNEEIQTVRFYYETMTLQSGGFVSTAEVTAPSSIRVLKYVYMPATKTGYKYEYHPYYGMIRKITRQVGMSASTTATNTTGTLTEGIFAASTEYDYPNMDGNSPQSDVPKYTKRTDDWQGRTAQDPQETLYDFWEDVDENSIPTDNSAITVKDNGFDVETKTVSNRTTGLLMETSISRKYSTGTFDKLMSKSVYTWSTTENRNLIKLETTNEAGLVKKTEFDYDQYNNQSEVREYDYGTSSPALLRKTQIEYETGSGWINNNLLSLPKSVKTIVGSVTVSKTLYEYDHNGNDSTLTLRTDIDTTGTHDTTYNPSHPAEDEEICPLAGDGCVIIHHPGYSSASAYRGNVTKVTAFSDATLTTDPNADVNNYEYDITGNLVSATLSCCQLKTIDYGSTFSVTGYAYPISETKGTSPTQLTTSGTYNRNTGLMLTSTDENSQVTTYEYETDTLRPKKTTYPNSGYVLTEYSDKLITNNNDLLPGFIRTTTTLDSTHTAQSYSYFNGGGRGIRSASQTPDGWSISAVEFDKLGRPVKSYNPFYASTPTGAIPSGTKYAEVQNYDAFGRTTALKRQDNTTVSISFSDLTNTPSGFNKTFVTVTDQAGKQRRQVADSLGRIVRVDEPDVSGSLGAVDSPNQPTYYEYDGNDNLTKVTQSDGTVTQERLFKYDSLSRLTHERQVEATPTLNDAGTKVTSGGLWTKVLKYDEHGLLTEGTDARGVKTSFVYDGLNRVSSVTFTDDTPTVTYTYDQARTGFYNNGALTRVETASGGTNRPETLATATEFDYDKMGRVVKHRQAIGTQTYELEYGYNLAGQLTSEKYPSGRTVSINYDASGRLSQIADASRTYLSNLQYQSNGGILSGMTLGNGIQQTFGYNDRLQMTQIAWSKDSNLIQRYDYAFGQINPNNNTVDATKNNGQLAQIESYNGGTVSNPTKQFTQKFIYDSIGRLEKETEYRGDNNNQVYQQKFSYDRFGNRYLKSSENPSNQNPLLPSFIEDNNIDKTTNRLASNTNTSYDEAGNVTIDNKYRALKYFYDANGRMYKTSQTNDMNQNYAVFDASGSKVATKVNDAWRFLIYDIGGKLVAEYGGMTSADEGGVKYIHQDLQGSTRTITRASGQVQARIDYQAFGEEISNNIGQRVEQGYGTQYSLRKRYGVTERDEATGLDDTWWRKHENRSGRWTSPDPYNGSMSLGNPQSFNRYTYVENQPTNFVDPSGLQIISYKCFCVDGTVPGWTDPNPQCQTCYMWVPDNGGPNWINVGGNEPIFGGGGGSGQTRGCGVNPVTGNPYIDNDRPDPQTGLRQGGLGNIRPGNGGRGGFRERSDGGHDAVDIVAPVGTNILANRSGTVVAAISGYKPANTSKKREAQAGGLGNVVIIDHGDGIYTMYAHLTDVNVKVGDSVVQGKTIIGTSGRTGNANNDKQPEEDDHVHFAVFKGPVKKNGFPVSKSQYINPVFYLNSNCSKSVE